MCLLIIRKVVQRKTHSSKRKIWFGFQESVFLLFWTKKQFSEVMKKLEMSFDPQTFDCYIFFLLFAFLLSFS
jgi:hypothetical protein